MTKLLAPVQKQRGVEVVSEISSGTEISGHYVGLITIPQWEGPDRASKQNLKLNPHNLK